VEGETGKVGERQREEEALKTDERTERGNKQKETKERQQLAQNKEGQ